MLFNFCTFTQNRNNQLLLISTIHHYQNLFMKLNHVKLDACMSFINVDDIIIFYKVYILYVIKNNFCPRFYHVQWTLKKL